MSKYILFCEVCGKKTIVEQEELNKMASVASSKIQTKLPFLDADTKKSSEGKMIEQNKRYKCKCGYLVKAKNITIDPQSKLDDARDLEARIQRQNRANEGKKW